MITISKLFFTAVLALSAAACALDVENTETLTDRKQFTHFKAVTEDATTTIVYVGDALKPVWSYGDLVTIFNGVTRNDKYNYNGQDGDNGGDFSLVSTGSGSPQDVGHVYAVYPYDSRIKISLHRTGFYYITTTLPAEQHYKAISFGIGANLMLAVTDDDHLEFKNVCGYLKLLLYGDDVSVSKITIKGNNDEKIAGQANISMQNGVPDINLTKLTKNEISLVCDPPVVLGTKATSPTAFWFVIPPTNFTKGFTITVTDATGEVFEQSTSNPITVTRNKVEGMSALEVVLSEPPTPPTPDSKPDTRNVFLAGDSHVARAASLRKKNIPRWGWGEKLEEKLSALPNCTLTPQVVNAAQGGRSSEDFKGATHHRWQTYIAPYLAAGDLVIIEFAPNDYGQDIDLDQYAANLVWYINKTKQKSAFPVLITPPNTCTFEADNWTVIESFWSEYSDKMREVADVTNTPLVDVEHLSQEWLRNKGYTAALPYYMRSYNPNDLGHLREPGAGLVAGWVAQGLCDLGYWY